MLSPYFESKITRNLKRKSKIVFENVRLSENIDFKGNTWIIYFHLNGLPFCEWWSLRFSKVWIQPVTLLEFRYPLPSMYRNFMPRLVKNQWLSNDYKFLQESLSFKWDIKNTLSVSLSMWVTRKMDFFISLLGVGPG